ncbi:MAG: beta-ketoacyl-ACP synthase II [Paludibacteraceae bacterium]|nr:beta-ketoacyl-ACP synthase II [Paludibacteraceae bacterium]
MELRRVVVTGLGAVTPIGNDLPTTWKNMVAGKSGAGEVTQFDVTKFRSHFACEVKNFNFDGIMDPKDARRLDRYSQFSVYVAKEALEDSALNLEQEDKDRIGIIWGSGMGGLRSFEEGVVEFATGDGMPHYNPFFIPKALHSMGVGHISLEFGLTGPAFIVSSACASSSHAIGQAFDAVRLGRADVVLTGGADADITASGIGGFNAMRAISTRNDSPETASRPFSKSRDGFVLGEGGACLILEEYEHAKARGAKIYAEIVGVGATSDAYHMTAPDPEGKGAIKVMKAALADAGLQPTDIDFINTHGTSTPLGDIAELGAIRAVFGDHIYEMNLDSTKSMTGHLVGAAGAIEAVACVKALETGIIPPTINHEEGDEDERIDYKVNYTFNVAQKRDIRYALSNNFGFGGLNACLIFKKAED